MSNQELVIELTDRELRTLWFTPKSRSKPLVTDGQIERIPLPAGVMQQGIVLDSVRLLEILQMLSSGGRVRTHLLVPYQMGFIRKYTLPRIAKGERRAALQYLVLDDVPIDPSDVVFDYCSFETQEGDHLDVLLGATRRSVMETYFREFLKAGLEIVAVNFAVCTMSNVLPLTGKENVLYLDSEGDVLRLILFHEHAPEYIRIINLPVSTDSLEGEIQRVLFYYGSHQSDIPVHRLIWNGDLTAAHLAAQLFQGGMGESLDHLQSSLGEPIDPACLACRGYLDQLNEGREGINLLAFKWKARREGRLQQAALGAGLILSLVTFTVSLFLDYRQEALAREVQVLAAKGRVTEDSLKAREGQLKAWENLMHRPHKVGEYLASLYGLGPDLTIEHLEYKDGQLIIQASTNKVERIEYMIREMRRIGWQQPVLRSYHQDNNLIRFSVSAQNAALQQKTGDRPQSLGG